MKTDDTKRMQANASRDVDVAARLTELAAPLMTLAGSMPAQRLGPPRR